MASALSIKKELAKALSFSKSPVSLGNGTSTPGINTLPVVAPSSDCPASICATVLPSLKLLTKPIGSLFIASIAPGLLSAVLILPLFSL